MSPFLLAGSKRYGWPDDSIFCSLASGSYVDLSSPAATGGITAYSTDTAQTILGNVMETIIDSDSGYSLKLLGSASLDLSQF